MADKPGATYKGLREFAWMAGLLDFFGLRTLMLSAAVGVALGAWSLVKGLPGPTVVVYALLAAASMTFLAMVGTAMRAKASTALAAKSGGTDILVEVRNQSFNNETVTLDGHDYINCDFHDCTFRYDGGGYTATACRIHGTNRRIQSANVVVARSLDLASSLGLATHLNIEVKPGSPGDPPSQITK